MNDAKFIIIEDDPRSIQSYRKYLTNGGIREADIWPPASEADELRDARWIRVRHTVSDLTKKGYDPQRGMVVLILDLALNTLGESAQGIEEVIKSKDFLESYVQLVISDSADSAEASLGETVDGLLAKRELDRSDSDTPRFGHFKFWNSLRAAAARWQARTNRQSTLPPPAPTPVVADEISTMLFRARFGVRCIEEVATYIGASEEASEAPEVTIVDGGFSGSAVLLLNYKTTSGRRALALKLSESKERLAQEARAADDAVGAANKFDNAINSTLSPPRRLPLGDRTVYFSQQVVVEGRTVEDAVLDKTMSPRDFDLFANALERFLKNITAAGVRDGRKRNAKEVFALSPMQCARFVRAFDDLVSLDRAISKRKSGKTNKARPSDMTDAQLLALSETWPELCERLFPETIPCYEQHGDFHGRNLLLASNGSFRLIDAARFSVWPAFYDLARFQLNLAVRLLDPTTTALHYLPERIPVWQHHWDSALAGAGATHDESDASLLLMRRFARLSKSITKIAQTHGQAVGGNKEVAKLMALCRCFDLVKMVAYVDLPAVRRLWLLRLLRQNMSIHFAAEK